MTQAAQRKGVDNKLILAAKRYAEAILEIAKSKNELDKVFEDFSTVTNVYDENEEFRNFINHPAIPAADKKDAVKQIFEGKISEDTLNLLNILIEKNKYSLIDTIAYCYELLLDEVKNILKVDVISAVEMDDDLKESLKNKLESKLQKTVKLDYEIKPEIIAGVILKIKDKTIDGSLAHKLDSLQRQLA